jgi:hypothetical protein
LIGLDELGKRLIGRAEQIELPPERSLLREHAPLAKIRKRGSEIRVMAPVGGLVLAVGGPEDDWWVRVRPEPGASLSHLLQGSEAAAWYRRELERLQLALSAGGVASLADGGVLVEDLSEVCPASQWDSVCGEILLDV